MDARATQLLRAIREAPASSVAVVSHSMLLQKLEALIASEGGEAAEAPPRRSDAEQGRRGGCRAPPTLLAHTEVRAYSVPAVPLPVGPTGGQGAP